MNSFMQHKPFHYRKIMRKNNNIKLYRLSHIPTNFEALIPTYIKTFFPISKSYKKQQRGMKKLMVVISLLFSMFLYVIA